MNGVSNARKLRMRSDMVCRKACCFGTGMPLGRGVASDGSGRVPAAEYGGRCRVEWQEESKYLNDEN